MGAVAEIRLIKIKLSPFLLFSTRSVFTISPSELKDVLQSSSVVKSSVMALPDGHFVRTVDVGKVIGTTI
ncbi:hemagglutinin-like domain protein [Pseudomonas paraeruginosa]|uniref:Hemagglutinin-like domain protein n=1 Tax=Pseudomonas paraeruginosa TaxID=2994495 RepID=A0A2R3IPD8_9PSED|nr:hemagglutinin-like domain protein [Pseudomonas paraeruginosa]AWE94266.1 hemagglutinin-like domain protein [Pseudomonas paraeruginosa]